MQKGIDVWEGNGNINWDNVDTDFAILRLGYIGNNENKKDSKFEQNYNECKSRGIPVGVYVYDYAKSIDRVEQCARWVIDELKGKSFELPVYIDMEQESITYLGKDYLTSICIAFNTIIENAGFKAGVYANRNWFDNHLNKDVLKEKYNCWIANYGVNLDKYEGEYDLLQYSEHGKVNGISGDVDLNVMYSDVPQPTPQPTPEPPYEDETIRDIQRWLNDTYNTGIAEDNIYGPATKKALVKALQAELNRQYGAGLVVDGIFGSRTKSKCPNVKRGAKGNITKTIQSMLYCRMYNPGYIDGGYGLHTEGCIIRFQANNGLVEDGVCGKNTFEKLFS